MDYVLPAQTSAGQWQVSIPPNTLPGVYTGTETAWNDANVNGLLDAIEARDTTILKLTVNSKKIINVVENPLDLGLATPGAVVKGTITIINAGNIALANLRGVTGLLDFGPGIDDIPVVNSTFTTNPIGALPIANTTYATVSVTIKNPQATGPYTGTFRVYDDVNGNGVCDGEIYKDFPVKVQIGIKAITVTSAPATFGAQNPNTSPSQGFLIKNTGRLPLANVKWMEGSMTDGTNVIPAASTTFPAPSPVPPFGMAIGFEPACSVQLVVGPYVPAGNYVGTQTVWGDVDGGGTIDPGEASATFQTTVTVNGVASMTMATDSVAFGTWKPGDTTTHIEIGFQNTGNTVLNALTWSFLDLQKPPDLISTLGFRAPSCPPR